MNIIERDRDNARKNLKFWAVFYTNNTSTTGKSTKEVGMLYYEDEVSIYV